VRGAGPAHLGDDGAGDDVSRRKFVGKPLACGVPQNAALASQRRSIPSPKDGRTRASP